MLTRTAIAVLASSLIGAGAYAMGQAVEAERPGHNVTVVEKNQSWPVKGLITMEPCKVRACLEV